MKKIIILIGFYFVFISNVTALTYGGCEYSTISRMKSLVSNVNISYDYYIKDNQAYFNITLNNITSDIYFVDEQTNKQYYYSNTQNGEITIRDYLDTKIRYSFYSANNNCYGVKLANKYITLPTYNVYYEDELCKENSGYSLCQKWANVAYGYDELERLINEYNEQKNKQDNDDNKVIYEKTFIDNIIEFYTQYYYLILIVIIVICNVIMFIVRKRDNKFNL